MLGQTSDDEIDSKAPLIKIKVYDDSYQLDVTVPAQSTFGELKRVLDHMTGLAPEEQRLLFRGKEKDNHEHLHVAGVKHMSRVVLLEDHVNRERKIKQRQRDQGNAKAFEAVTAIRHEVDKLINKVVELDESVEFGTKVADQEFVVLTELLMMQLLKLDGIEAEGDVKLERKIEVRRIHYFVDVLDALKQAAKNPNPFRNSSNGSSSTIQSQTFDSGRGEDAPVMIKEATPSRVRPRESCPSNIDMPSSVHKRRRPHHMEPSRASTDCSASLASQRLLTPEEVPLEPILPVDVEPIISEDFEAGTSSTFSSQAQASTKSIIAETIGPLAGMPVSLDPLSTSCPVETSTRGDFGHTEALDMSVVPTFPPMVAPLCHIGTSSSETEGEDYESEIFCRRPLDAGSQNKGMQDRLLMFLRDLISNLDPRSPDSFDCFTSDANAVLNFLAHIGLDEAGLRYWEELCREVEFMVRQFKALSIVHAKASLPELRQQVRHRRAAIDIAHGEYQRSVEAMERHHDKSAGVAEEMESLSSKIKSLQEELTSLISCKTDLQVEFDRRAQVMEREQHRLQIRHRTMTDAKVAFTKAEENLKATEVECQALATLASQLRVLQSRLL